jgi:hypothetical protein
MNHVRISRTSGVLSETGAFRQRLAPLPGALPGPCRESTSFSTAMICSSLYRLFFMGPPIGGLPFEMVQF